MHFSGDKSGDNFRPFHRERVSTLDFSLRPPVNQVPVFTVTACTFLYFGAGGGGGGKGGGGSAALNFKLIMFYCMSARLNISTEHR